MIKIRCAIIAAALAVGGAAHADSVDQYLNGAQNALNNAPAHYGDGGYSQRVLDQANSFNPSGDSYYPGTNQILQNATDGSGALRIAR